MGENIKIKISGWLAVSIPNSTDEDHACDQAAKILLNDIASTTLLCDAFQKIEIEDMVFLPDDDEHSFSDTAYEERRDLCFDERSA